MSEIVTLDILYHGVKVGEIDVSDHGLWVSCTVPDCIKCSKNYNLTNISILRSQIPELFRKNHSCALSAIDNRPSKNNRPSKSGESK